METSSTIRRLTRQLLKEKHSKCVNSSSESNSPARKTLVTNHGIGSYPFVSRISIRNTFSVTSALLLVMITAVSLLLYSCNLVNSSGDNRSGACSNPVELSIVNTSPENNLRIRNPPQYKGLSIIVTSPEDNVRKADLIIEAEVLDIRYVESSQGVSFAEITLMVRDRIVGKSPNVIKIRRPFVTPDLVFLDSKWLPTYKIRERFIITLLGNPDSEIYTTLGLYNGKFIIDNNLIQNTTITVDQFKQYILDIRNHKMGKFPDKLPRMC